MRADRVPVHCKQGRCQKFASRADAKSLQAGQMPIASRTDGKNCKLNVAAA